MKKSQFSQLYSVFFVILLVSCFSIFISLIRLWSSKNIVFQDFSDLKTTIYYSHNFGVNNSLSFNNSVNLSVVDNVLFFNSSGFCFSKNFSNINLNSCNLVNVNNISVYGINDKVVFK